MSRPSGQMPYSPALSALRSAWVRENPNLSTSARLLYMMLAARAEAAGGNSVAIAAADLAQRLGLGVERISYLNTELRKAGAIETAQQGNGKPMRYTLLTAAAMLGTSAAVDLLLQAGGHGAHVLAHLSELKGHALLISGYSSEHPDRANENAGSVDAGQAKTFGQHPSPLPPGPPIPAAENLDNTTTSARQLELDDVVVVDSLTQNGVTYDVAVQLVITFGRDRCTRQLKALAYRHNVKDTGAYLRMAIVKDYALPKPLLDRARRIEEQRQLEERRSREAEAVLAAATKRETDKLLAELPREVLYTLEQDVEVKLEQLPLARMMGPDAKRGMREGMLLRAAMAWRAENQPAVSA